MSVVIDHTMSSRARRRPRQTPRQHPKKSEHTSRAIDLADRAAFGDPKAKEELAKILNEKKR